MYAGNRLRTFALSNENPVLPVTIDLEPGAAWMTLSMARPMDGTHVNIAFSRSITDNRTTFPHSCYWNADDHGRHSVNTVRCFLPDRYRLIDIYYSAGSGPAAEESVFHMITSSKYCRSSRTTSFSHCWPLSLPKPGMLEHAQIIPHFLQKSNTRSIERLFLGLFRRGF